MKNLRILMLAMMLVGTRESVFAGEGNLSESLSKVNIDEKSESSNDENHFEFYTQELYEEYLEETKKLCPNETDSKYKLMIYLQMAKCEDDDNFIISLKKYDEQGLQNMLDHQLSSFDNKTEYMIVRYVYDIKSKLPADASILTSAIEEMADEIHQSKLSELIEFADYLLKSHENGEVVDWKLEAKRAKFHINPPTDKDDLEDIFLYQRDAATMRALGAVEIILKALGGNMYANTDEKYNEYLREIFSQDKEKCKAKAWEAVADIDDIYTNMFGSGHSSTQKANTVRILFDKLMINLDSIFAKYKDEFKKMRQEETDAMWQDKSKATKVSQDLDESDKEAMIVKYGTKELYEFVVEHFVRPEFEENFAAITEENKSKKLDERMLRLIACEYENEIVIRHIKNSYEDRKYAHIFLKEYANPKAEEFAKNYIENLKKS